MLLPSCLLLLLLRAESKESSTSKAKSPPSLLLSMKKREKSSEKRESEPRRRSRVHKSFEEVIFRYSIFKRRNSNLQCWVFCVSFFLSRGRLLNRNISNDIWVSFHPLLSLIFLLNCSCLNWAGYFSSLVWTTFLSVCVDSLVLSLSTMCVRIAWCWAYKPMYVCKTWCCIQQPCV